MITLSHSDSIKDNTDVFLLKLFTTTAAFLLEDVSQTFCQFLFFEKYQTSLDQFSIINGAVMVILGVLVLKATIQTLRNEYEDDCCTNCLVSLVVIFPITVIGTQIVRLALILYQSTRQG